MFYVYILKSKSRLYTGYSLDLQRRVIEHNASKNVSTKAYAPWRLIYYEAHTNAEDAHRREQYLKTWQGKQAIKRMLRKALLTDEKRHF
jgi:putative endonuclease